MEIASDKVCVVLYALCYLWGSLLSWPFALVVLDRHGYSWTVPFPLMAVCVSFAKLFLLLYMGLGKRCAGDSTGWVELLIP
jgi:hypothetical protein